MIKPTVTLTDPVEQAKAAEYFVRCGGIRPASLAGAIGITPKKARKLIKQARRKTSGEARP